MAELRNALGLGGFRFYVVHLLFRLTSSFDYRFNPGSIAICALRSGLSFYQRLLLLPPSFPLLDPIGQGRIFNPNVGRKLNSAALVLIEHLLTSRAWQSHSPH